jgi:hypothetical protein
VIPSSTKWFDIVPEPANKLTYLTFRTHYASNIERTFNGNVPSTHILEENTVTMPWYLMLPRYVPFTETFKKKVDQLLSSGSIQKVHAFVWGIDNDKKRLVEEFQPRVLTVFDLRLGFLAFLICATISFVVFFIELKFKRA